MNPNPNKLYCEDLGIGEPLLLINGLARSSRHWLSFLPLLAEHFRVIAPDNPGIGRSKHLRQTFVKGVSAVSEHYLELLDELELDQVHLVGLSLGGMIALDLATKIKERAKSLTMINSSAADLPWPRLRIRGISALVRVSFLENQKQQRELAKVLLNPEDNQEIVNAWAEIENLEPVETRVVIQQLAAASRFFLAGRRKHIRCPVTIIYGDRDKLVSSLHSKFLAKMLSAQLLRIKGGGHEMTADRPEEIADAIAQSCLSRKR